MVSQLGQKKNREVVGEPLSQILVLYNLVFSITRDTYLPQLKAPSDRPKIRFNIESMMIKVNL